MIKLQPPSRLHTDSVNLPWPATHPHARQLRGPSLGADTSSLTVELEEGDALHIPPGWVHEVTAIERSFALSLTHLGYEFNDFNQWATKERHLLMPALQTMREDRMKLDASRLSSAFTLFVRQLLKRLELPYLVDSLLAMYSSDVREEAGLPPHSRGRLDAAPLHRVGRLTTRRSRCETRCCATMQWPSMRRWGWLQSALRRITTRCGRITSAAILKTCSACFRAFSASQARTSGSARCWIAVSQLVREFRQGNAERIGAISDWWRAVSQVVREFSPRKAALRHQISKTWTWRRALSNRRSRHVGRRLLVRALLLPHVLGARAVLGVDEPKFFQHLTYWSLCLQVVYFTVDKSSPQRPS